MERHTGSTLNRAVFQNLMICGVFHGQPGKTGVDAGTDQVQSWAYDPFCPTHCNKLQRKKRQPCDWPRGGSGEPVT